MSEITRLSNLVDMLELLARAREEFERRVRLASSRLDQATPCDTWRVRDLLQHVIVGNCMAVVMLAGRTRAEVDVARAAITARDQLRPDPASAFVESADAQASAFAQPDALHRTCNHVVGDIPGARLLTFRICDLTIHAWDLARGIGADETLNGSLLSGYTGRCHPWRQRSGRLAGSAMGQAALFLPTHRYNAACSTSAVAARNSRDVSAPSTALRGGHTSRPTKFRNSV
jgi:uncharacterized protein (TIGR03086 family)